MPSLDVLLAFAAAACAVIVIPGPTVLLVTSYALSAGMRSALLCIAGVCAGDMLAMTLTFFGLGVVLAASATVFTWLKWLGAAYLLYLGVQLWRARGGQSVFSGAAERQPWRIVGRAFMVNILHPKGLAFYAAFMPQFIAPTRPVLPQMLVLGAIFSGIALLVLLAYALLASRCRQWLVSPRAWRIFNRMGATCLVAAGLFTASLQPEN
ncbi:MAG: LysE family translocator [Azonexus sp.]|jgi:threonine/homoserine/homoserine lactone efflux protein|nr:LysE family translocator [Azonexus sp.]